MYPDVPDWDSSEDNKNNNTNSSGIPPKKKRYAMKGMRSSSVDPRPTTQPTPTDEQHHLSGNGGSPSFVTVGTDYRVGKKIGEGKFGVVRIGKNLLTNEHVAVKTENTHRNCGTLLPLEYKYYHMMGNADGFPKCYYFGKCGNNNALVMELLGLNLEDLLTICGGKFSAKTVSKIAIQAITRVESLHSFGLVHRDIKPENFLIGRMSTHRDRVIHLVDLGLAKEFVDPQTGRHIPYKDHMSLTGSVRYMSLNAHLGREHSRRDDLEALGHTLLYLLKGSLPWQGLKAETLKERYKKIGEVKRATPIDKLCAHVPEAFNAYMKYTRKLEFFEAPDYGRLRLLFTNCLVKEGGEDDADFEWTSRLKRK